MPGGDELPTLRRQLADLEELADIGFWDHDLLTGATRWSDGQRRLHGLAAGRNPGRDEWLAMVHADDRDRAEGAVEAAIDRCGEFTLEHRFVRASDGALRRARSRGRVHAGPDGRAARVFCVTVDITAQHESAAALYDFIAHAAHELRTPAAAIAQAVQALDLAEGPDRNAVLAILARQTSRLRALTTNLVDLSMIGAGSPAALEPVALAEAVAEAVASAPAPDGRSLDVSGVPERLAVRADRGDLDRILVNLLTNAWRYGGPSVRVSAKTVDARVELRVADDGPGVPAEVRSSLFQPFRRGPQRHPEASGLGLAIVDGLVRRMGGWARYEDGTGGGAEFVVTLDAS